MKKILILIHGLGCGGAEKSLVSLLENLPHNIWSIDLIVASPNGMLMTRIPSYVHRVEGLYELESYATVLKERRKKVWNVRDFILQSKWQVQSRIIASSKLHSDEKRWVMWGRYLPAIEKKYDLAISYMNGFPNYFVIDKVVADKKILWIHNEFEKLGYNVEFESAYFHAADRIVTISQACVDSFLRVYPDLENKITVLENISSAEDIYEKAKKIPEYDPFFFFDGYKIVSIGRLSEQKNFALSIDAANILKEKGIKFIWYILGDGSLRQKLEHQIRDYDLQEQVKLVGIKDNPYPYIAYCDVFAQSSIYEGKSIVLDEAKILCKPIVITNYTTASNSIDTGKNGLVVDMTAESLASGIMQLLQDAEYREELIGQLRNEQNGNVAEIEKYISLFAELLGEKNEDIDCN